MHNAITLEALRVLDAIDRKGSFGAAAEVLFKVPSALTYTVQKLESDLGISIFDRSKQRAQLTTAGRLLLEQGRQLLQAATATYARSPDPNLAAELAALGVTLPDASNSHSARMTSRR